MAVIRIAISKRPKERLEKVMFLVSPRLRISCTIANTFNNMIIVRDSLGKVAWVPGFHRKVIEYKYIAPTMKQRDKTILAFRYDKVIVSRFKFPCPPPMC